MCRLSSELSRVQSALFVLVACFVPRRVAGRKRVSVAAP